MSYHLYVNVEEIDHQFNEDVELFFRLYDAETKQFIRCALYRVFLIVLITIQPDNKIIIK